MAKTVLLKYYNKTTKCGNKGSQNGRVGHRDEFVRCTVCSKRRRFRLRNKEECQVYHNAFKDAKWKCSDTPYEKYVHFLCICNFIHHILSSIYILTRWL